MRDALTLRVAREDQHPGRTLAAIDCESARDAAHMHASLHVD
jgi:hypothetical protein